MAEQSRIENRISILADMPSTYTSPEDLKVLRVDRQALRMSPPAVVFEERSPRRSLLLL